MKSLLDKTSSDTRLLPSWRTSQYIPEKGILLVGQVMEGNAVPAIFIDV